jgi:hypothetical protein
LHTQIDNKNELEQKQTGATGAELRKSLILLAAPVFLPNWSTTGALEQESSQN